MLRLTLQTRAAYVRSVEDKWRAISLDILAAAPDRSMLAEEVQAITADYIRAPGWFELSWQDRESILLEALPNDQAIRPEQTMTDPPPTWS